MFALLLSLLSLSAFAEPIALEDSVLAQASFRNSRPRLMRMTVQTCNSKGKVAAVKLSVVEGSLKLSHMDAVYVAGGSQRLANNVRLEKNQSTGWLPLTRRDNPCVARLELNLGPSTSRTKIEVMGRWEK